MREAAVDRIRKRRFDIFDDLQPAIHDLEQLGEAGGARRIAFFVLDEAVSQHHAAIDIDQRETALFDI